MLAVAIDRIGDMAVVECAGRLVRSESALKLREAVISQPYPRIIVIDLSEVTAIEGTGLGMLVSLQHWTFDRHIQLKLFNPRTSVLNSLNRMNSMQEFDLATLHEMMALLELRTPRYAA